VQAEDAGAAAKAESDWASRWAAICEWSDDAIIGWTPDGVVTNWNSGAERIYGYTADEIRGRDVSVLIPPARAGLFAAVLDRLSQGEHVEMYDAKAQRKDGHIIDISLSLSPIRDAGGVVTGVSSVARDVTERNRAEAERLALQRQLQEAERMETLGRLAGGIAHDFNNILGAITNYAGFIAEESRDRPGVRADAEQIQAAAQRAAALTRQLLIFTQRDVTQPEALALNLVIAEIGELLSTAVGRHVDLRIEAAADLPAIRADRGQIGQVLLNLAVNARDAIVRNGTLTIGTSLSELGTGDSRLPPGVSPGRYVTLTVSDTGVGMSAEVAARIFEPFFTTKSVGKGTGLGLATMHAIVTKAAGFVTVESEEGAGTTFRLYFPAIDLVVAAPEAAPGDHPGQTILVVDDEPAVLEVTGRILRQNGYATLQARTYEQALSLAASRDFQLLLTDSVMPGMTGATLAELITEMKPGTPVLHMSGYTAGVLDRERIRDGELPFIQKPFTAPALLEKVRRVLKARQGLGVIGPSPAREGSFPLPLRPGPAGKRQREDEADRRKDQAEQQAQALAVALPLGEPRTARGGDQPDEEQVKRDHADGSVVLVHVPRYASCTLGSRCSDDVWSASTTRPVSST
jgi:two-component system cell cycle sensor histidine kinase/response regulator CckA